MHLPGMDSILKPQLNSSLVLRLHGRPLHGEGSTLRGVFRPLHSQSLLTEHPQSGRRPSATVTVQRLTVTVRQGAYLNQGSKVMGLVYQIGYPTQIRGTGRLAVRAPCDLQSLKDPRLSAPD
jgi:hypothetical protein